MHKVHLLLLPIVSLAFASCANNGINYISVGEAIEFAKENFDPHLDDGYNVNYTINFNDSKLDSGKVYQKHYYDPTKQEGEYFIDKVGDFDIDLRGVESLFYYTRCINFSSAKLLELHEAFDVVRRDIGYIDNGFIKVNNHLGYYINSDYLYAITGVLDAIVDIFAEVIQSELVKILHAVLSAFSNTSESTFTFQAEFTRFGFLDNVNLKITAKNAWFNFEGSGLPDTFFGDYISIKNINANATFKAHYSL